MPELVLPIVKLARHCAYSEITRQNEAEYAH